MDYDESVKRIPIHELVERRLEVRVLKRLHACLKLQWPNSGMAVLRTPTARDVRERGWRLLPYLSTARNSLLLHCLRRQNETVGFGGNRFGYREAHAALYVMEAGEQVQLAAAPPAPTTPDAAPADTTLAPTTPQPDLPAAARRRKQQTGDGGRSGGPDFHDCEVVRGLNIAREALVVGGDRWLELMGQAPEKPLGSGCTLEAPSAELDSPADSNNTQAWFLSSLGRRRLLPTTYPLLGVGVTDLQGVEGDGLPEPGVVG
ncbi:hypothetical protein CkaCkLH20_12607 [Colletotrichum karsti]|uniref:Uncharacterized protein n=1 Tax=Colletotrichum karsti TaxID=1095194 RepID=A0A9P6HTX3_9PEZI|nr:uncharacterized protein CkaCkLH20_12607 [Colletotrichum karsti]KAF9869900.1 hypothetical protein CkaCkLH20_12607 [Colletotrichum karsti]